MSSAILLPLTGDCSDAAAARRGQAAVQFANHDLHGAVDVRRGHAVLQVGRQFNRNCRERIQIGNGVLTRALDDTLHVEIRTGQRDQIGATGRND